MPNPNSDISLGGGGGGGATDAQVTETVYVPAQAFFEHPTPATTLFEAADGGSAGLTVTLGEPLEYGLEPNDWSIIGMQRYQGIADTPQQNPTLVERDYASGDTDLQDYLGVFANDAAAAADSNYDLTRSQMYWRTQDRRTRHHNINSADWLSSPNQANERARLGGYMLSFPYVPGSGSAITDYSYADSAAAVAHILANNFAAGVNNDNSRYSFDRNYVYYNQAQGKLKFVTDLNPAQGAVAATADMPTSATGGLRITATPAGSAGNAFYVRATASNVTGVSYNAPAKEFNVIVNNNANAQAVRNAFNSDADNQGFSMAYYGTEDGTTVVSSGNVLVSGFGTRRQFSGGNDGTYVVPQIDGEPADPIHIILDHDNEEMEIFYNRAAGGALTGPDTMGDIRDYINSHLAGLSAEFTGGADADTEITRSFATRSQFSGGALSGLEILMTEPLALGAAGNGRNVKARERFTGGAPQAETQATLRIYTDVSRARGVLITLEAGITDVQSQDVSSGQLGNDWVFRVLSPTEQFTGRATLNISLREINYYAHTADDGEMDTALQLLTALNAGGTGVSAAYFGAGNTGTELIFAGSLGRINAGQRDFTGGLDAHAGGGESPISVAIGPSNATARVSAFGAGGVELEIVDPAGAAGNGWVVRGEAVQAVGSLTLDADARELVARGDGSIIVSTFLDLLEDIPGITGRIYGGADLNDNINITFRHEFLGGLDGDDIEIRYSTSDSMEEVKTVIDAVDGLQSYYYGGATAGTTASRHTPWEAEFADGETLTLDLSGFALGYETNEFTGANRAAAEAARDSYAAANPAWVESYKDVTARREARGAQARIWIALRWGTEQVGQILRANASNPPSPSHWIEQDIALKGSMGERGLRGPKGDPGDDAGGGTTVTTYSLGVGKATAANVLEGAEVTFQSVTGDFFIVVEPTETAPRIRLNVPDGRTLDGVFDQGVDISADFTREGATQVWLSNVDYDGGGLMLFVRTSAS